MATVDVDEIADRLYALPAEEFTAARDEAARNAADPDLRKAVKALRKPVASAHEVNRLARDRPADIDALLDLGARLRNAMGGDPNDVRRLSEERRDRIAGLVNPELTAGVQQDVTATLEAATADPELGSAVRSGRLVKPLRYAGFGAMPDLSDALATPLSRNPAPEPAKPEQSTPEQPTLGLTAARERVLELSGIADDAQRRYEQAARHAADARRLLEEAEAARAEAHKAARAAHTEAEKARRDLGRLERS
jgi:hypothetical protein